MLLVMFINIRYLCISVYIFREFCMSVCRIYESVHIKKFWYRSVYEA